MLQVYLCLIILSYSDHIQSCVSSFAKWISDLTVNYDYWTVNIYSLIIQSKWQTCLRQGLRCFKGEHSSNTARESRNECQCQRPCWVVQFDKCICVAFLPHVFSISWHCQQIERFVYTLRWTDVVLLWWQCLLCVLPKCNKSDTIEKKLKKKRKGREKKRKMEKKRNKWKRKTSH